MEGEVGQVLVDVLKQGKAWRARRKGSLHDGIRDQEMMPSFFDENLGLGSWSVKGGSASFPWAGPFPSPVGGRTPHPGQRGVLTCQNDSQNISRSYLLIIKMKLY